MKHFLIFVLLIASTLSLGAIEIDPVLSAAEGEWELDGERLLQSDPDSPRAKFAVSYPQAGPTEYVFNVRYEGGVLEDGHGGFGIHIFADEVKRGRAWGAGESWLLWLNYDVAPEGIAPGLSAQVYRSVNNSRMDLLADYDLNWALQNMSDIGLTLDDLLSQTVTIRLSVDPASGEVVFHDPFSEGYVYRFTLPMDSRSIGSMVVLRSNGMRISFAQ
jgi:hypothetical protein